MSPPEVLEYFLTRCERLNAQVNALVRLDVDGARAAARAAESRALRRARLSALDGIPVVIKDNLHVRGWNVTWGSRLYRDFVAPRDDIAIERLREAGAVLLGATNTPEFALNQYTDNLVFGATRNPWAMHLTPGGSSGGAVAALALGLAPLALGTDAGGSIRRPAAYTGVVGCRPSTGRIPRCFGFPPLAHDFQVIAPAARSTEDTYVLLRALAGPDPRDRLSAAFAALPAELRRARAGRLRIRCVTSAGDAPVDPEIRAAVNFAAAAFDALGHSVEPGPAPWSPERVDALWAVLSSAGLARVVEGHAGWKSRVHPSSRATAERGAQIAGTRYLEALDDLAALRLEFSALFETVDVLLTPTSAAMPWAIGEPYPNRIDGRDVGPRGAAVFATFVNAAGLTAVSIPGPPAASGLPTGLQLVGRFGEDAAVMALAEQYEQAHPWTQRWPAVAGSGENPPMAVKEGEQA